MMLHSLQDLFIYIISIVLLSLIAAEALETTKHDLWFSADILHGHSYFEKKIIWINIWYSRCYDAEPFRRYSAKTEV